MAVKEGVLAIAKVLNVAAVISFAACFYAGSNYGNHVFGVFFGIVSFLVFWTPAWVMKKFVQ